MNKNLKKSLAIILAVMLVFSLTVVPVAASDDTYRYDGDFAGVGVIAHTVIFELMNNTTEEVVKAYCADLENSIIDPTDYATDELGGNTTDSSIRAILFQSYPNVDVDDLEEAVTDYLVEQDLPGLTGELSRAQAITGIQYAIWYFTNGDHEDFDDNDLWGNAGKVYLYLTDNEDGVGTIDAQEVGSLDLTEPTGVILDNGDLEITFSYESPGTSELTYSPELSATWTVTEDDGDVTITVPASELPTDEPFTLDITLNGTETIEEAYYFIEDGTQDRAQSQKLVGILEDVKSLRPVNESFIMEFGVEYYSYTVNYFLNGDPMETIASDVDYEEGDVITEVNTDNKPSDAYLGSIVGLPLTITDDSEANVVNVYYYTEQDDEDYSLTTSVRGSGTIDPSGYTPYEEVTSNVAIVTDAAPGWHFDSWNDGEGYTVPDDEGFVTVDGDIVVQAIFVKNKRDRDRDDDPDPIIVIPDETPAAPAVIPPEIVLDVPPTPAAPAALPQTGGLDSLLLYGLGALLAGGGLTLRKFQK